MKELIRNCQHYGAHQTFFLRGEKGQVEAIEKNSFDTNNILSIKREFDGISWYCKTKGADQTNIISSFFQARGYSRLVFKYHRGEVVDFSAHPGCLVDKISMAIDHYLEVFGRDNFRFSHGDYFLGNIVFDKNMVKWVIDWEHFNDKLPAGYDALNCIVVGLLSPYKKNLLSIKTNRERVKEIISNVVDITKLPDLAKKSPILWCREIIYEFKDIWGEQYNKLPQTIVSSEECMEIDKIIGV